MLDARGGVECDVGWGGDDGRDDPADAPGPTYFADMFPGTFRPLALFLKVEVPTWVFFVFLRAAVVFTGSCWSLPSHVWSCFHVLLCVCVFFYACPLPLCATYTFEPFSTFFTAVIDACCAVQSFFPGHVPPRPCPFLASFCLLSSPSFTAGLTETRLGSLFGPNLRPFCMRKVFMRQRGLDKPFTGGLGSFKLYALIASHLEACGCERWVSVSSRLSLYPAI